MKILQIRGANLASLAGEFEIDLEHGALGRAGLFAITGPTGSGKSSILDAICLALYNEVPRTANQTNRSKAPAGGDAELSLNDPRHVLRRGAGEGYAEVVFRATDGEIYHARWTVHRSRKRATGKLQGQKMTLKDNRGQGIGGATNTSVLTAIAERTGLTFAQFRRAILLAQGDFAAFLKAGTEDRANLLEAMTGTEIYGVLSVLAFERRKTWDEAIKEAEQELALAAPLAPEARAALELEKSEADQTVAHIADERAGVGEVLTWFKTLDERAAKRTEAHKRFVEVQAEAAAAKPRRAELAAAQRAWALRVSVRDARAATDEQLRLTRVLEQARTASRSALETATETRSSLAAARTRLASVSSAYVSGLAAALDGDVERAKTLGDWLAANAAIAPLATPGRVDDIAQRVLGWNAMRAAIPQARDKAAQLAETIISSEAGLPALASAADIAETESAAAGAAEQRATDALAKHDPNRIDERARELARREKLLEQLRGAMLQREGVVEQRDDLTRELEAGRIAENAARTEREAIAPELSAAGARLEEAQRILRKYQGALSADEWRAKLEPDTECPVCGSTDHPWADSSAVRDLFGEHEKRVRELDEAHRALRDKSAALETAVDAATKRVARARSTLDAATNKLDALDRERAQLVSAAGDWDVADADTAAAALGGEREDIASHRAALDRDRNALVAASKQAGLAAKTAAAAQKRRASAESALGQLRSDLDLARTKLDTHVKRRDELATSLHKELAPLDLAADWPSAAAAEACVSDLRERVRQWLENEHERTVIEASIQDRRTAHAAALEVLPQDLGGLDATAVEIIAPPGELADEDQLAWLRGQRGACREAVSRDFDRVEHAKSAVTDAEKALAVAAGAHTSHVENTARKAAELSADLTAANLTLDDVARWLDVDDQWRERTADALGQLDDKLVSAGAVVESQDKELVAYRESAPAQSREHATTSLAALDTALKEHRAAAATLAARLLADDERKRATSAGTDKLDRLRAEAKPWLQISELIGHNKGKTFKSYAQSVTLSMLLHGANAHLRLLNPRYELRASNLTELEVEVIDHDLADERRSVHHLSGGETFLTSLALALSLSTLAAGRTHLGSLFIDEGLGTLDIDTLDVALGLLENLHDTGRQVGLISHVQGLAERVAARIEVVPQGGGKSYIELPAD